MLLLWLIVTTVAFIQEVKGRNQFNGGSLSFSVREENGTYYAEFDLITGWVFGKGPCGPNCQQSDIGKSTKTKRDLMIQAEQDPLYFGNWTSEFKQHRITHTSSINSLIDANYKEEVIAFNEVAKWEQAWMQVTVPLQSPAGVAEEDIYFEGDTWHPLNMQTNDLKWHIQGKVRKSNRSDTGTPNRSPKAYVKPYYRVKLNQVKNIHIAATDPDGDKIECALSLFAEAGELTKNSLNGTSVSDDCILSINASEAFGFHDDAWCAIALTVRDYNKASIKVGSETIGSYSVALGGTAVQFLIQVLERLEAPEFVKPTADSNHHFILYAGTSWSQKIYAKASENTTISEFSVMGRHREILNKSDIKDGDDSRVKFVEITWIPNSTDVGNHLICITAVDNTGVDSNEDRCFSIEVKPDRFNHSSTIAVDRPYFIDLPDFQQAVFCKLDVTCVLPIYVMSNEKISNIDISKTFFRVTETGPITREEHDGDHVYKTDMSFRDTVDGVKKICLIAYDINGAHSDETCIQSKIDPPDPCASSPCRNSATCQQSKMDKTVYICHCLNDEFFGKNCDQRKDPCSPGVCGHGNCTTLPIGRYCTCGHSSRYSGVDCSILNDECTPDPCNQKGVCHNGTCTCFPRYSGDSCTEDTKCPSEPSGKLECTPNGCAPKTCNGNGVCQAGGTCICSLGYKKDATCSTGSGNPLVLLNQAGTKFVSPTLEGGSSLTCYIRNNGDPPCVVSLFFATTDSGKQTLTIARASPKILYTSSIGNVSHVHLFGNGLTHTYTADLSVEGGTEPEKLYICVQVQIGHNADHRCFQISYITNPMSSRKSMEFHQKNATYKFVSPTPTGYTNFKCYVNAECHILLYTNPVSNACEDVVTGDDEVYVFPAKKIGGYCFTETTYKFTSEGKKHICFKSSVQPSSQTRCYYVDVYSMATDKCSGTPCQNGGDCFHANLSDIYCVCKSGYEGEHCEKGECAPGSNQCDSESFCYSDGTGTQCICPVGKSGPLCSTSPSPQLGTKFTDTAVPVHVTCVVNRKCSFPLGVSSKSSNPMTLLFGFVSPHIRTEGIATESTKGHETLKATISVIPLEVGTKTVCIQTIVNNANDDEICIEVEVTKDTSLIYGRHDRPHFINPSLPPSAEVRCPVDEYCHVLFHVTPGDGAGNEKNCTKVSFTKSAFENGHIFTSCDHCAPGHDSNRNCSIDVSVKPQSTDLNQDMEVCVQVELTESHVKGEERCFNVTVQSKNDFNAKTGCQTITCHNKSFCDAHAVPPVCYCAPGYSGTDCSQHTGGASSGSTQGSFVNTFGVPEIVTCAVNTSCPITFHMTGPSNPTPKITTGYVDPRLTVDGNSTVKNATENNGYTGTINVTPGEPGPQKVCVQTESTDGTIDDEVCLTIQVVGTAPPEVEKDKPYFDPPTPLQGTTVLCNKGKMCNIEIQFPGAEKFQSGSHDDCPSLEDTSVVYVEGVHIFPPKLERRHPPECTSHIGYLSPSSASSGDVNKMCIQVTVTGKPGEERCFDIKIEDDVQATVVAPCRGQKCENEGKCVADLNVLPPTATCVCPKGYEGPSCSTVVRTDLNLPGTQPAPPLTSETPHFDGHSALPKEISCYTGESCNIPIGLLKGTKPPVLGYVDPNLITEKPKLIPGGGGAVTSVATKTPGTYKMCLQTTLSGKENGDNIDEVCFDVKVEQGPSSPPDITKPHFDKGMFPANSTVNCKLNDNCHIPVYTKPDSNGDCDRVKECPPGTAGVHVFKTTLDNGQCVTDLVYHTGANQETNNVCISAGPDGEERNVTVESINKPYFGPCQYVRCKNGGKCVADPSKTPPVAAVCVCSKGFDGQYCDTPAKTNTDLVGTQPGPTITSHTPHFDGESAIPKEISCYTGEPCSIPIGVKGTVPPVLGYVDPNLVTDKPRMAASGGSAITTVSTNKQGSYQMCLQTTVDGKENGDNIDETCFEVKVAQGPSAPPDTNKPHFDSGTIPAGSTVNCKLNSNCHVPVYTKPKSNGTCETVKECPPGKTGVHVFQTSLDNGTCVTDFVYHTGANDETNSVCISAGPDGEKRNITVEAKNLQNFGPCQTVRCKNGGKCVADLSATPPTSAVCVCKKGFDGQDCSTSITTPTDLPGVSPGPVSTALTPHIDGKAGIPKEITCVLGQFCNIPIPVTGDKPPVLGSTDPNLLVEKPTMMSTGTAVAKVKPNTSTPGTYKMCVQTTVDGSDNSENVDEVCLDVKVVAALTTPISTATNPNAPHFEKGSVPPESTVQCDTDTSCRVPVFTSPSPVTGKCEEVKECPPGLQGVHIFKPELKNGVCVTDAVYKTGTTSTLETLCLTPGLGGEERNVTIDVKPFTSFGPCQTQHCKNGKCLADPSTSSAVCACLKGLDGDKCETAITQTKGLPGVTPTLTTTAQMPFFDGKAGIPTELECVLNTPCTIPLPYHGAGTPKIGYAHPGLTHGDPKISTGGVAVTEVTPTTTGTKKICFQTTLDGTINSTNVDEICVDVKVAAGTSQSTPPQNKPHFSEETMTTNSKLTCDLDTSCHIPIYSEPMQNDECPQVTECPPGLSGVHMFETQKDASGKCITDAVYKTPSTPDTKTLCIAAGPDGEQRTLEVEVKKFDKFGPCQTLHCENGGSCSSGNGTPTCTCPNFVSGSNCHDVSLCISSPCQNNGICYDKTIKPSAFECICQRGWDGNTCSQKTSSSNLCLPGVKNSPAITEKTPRFDGTSGIPAEVVCEKDKECSIPVSYFGTNTLLPILGSVDPNLKASKPVIRPGKNETTFGPQSAVIKVVPSASGKLCVQTTLDGKPNGVNIDEMCIDVKVGGTTAINTAKPHFDNTNLPSGSKVICDNDIQCHIPLTFEKPANGVCPTISQCGSQLTNLVIGPSEVQKNKCVTDVVLKTETNPSNTDICLVQKPNGNELKISAETKDFAGSGVSFGPCQALHCENGGKCDSSTSTPKCICPQDVSGNKCEIVSPCRGIACQHGKCIVKGSGNTATGLCACDDGYEGTTCDKVETPTSSLPGVVNSPSITSSTPKFMEKTAILSELTCFVGKPCPIPFPYQGQQTNPPILGHVDSGLNATRPTAIAGKKPGEFVATTVVTPNPSSSGTERVCIQTTVNGLENGTNVDEICVNITVEPTANAPPPPTPGKASFTQDNLPHGSTVACNIDSSCHMPVLTKTLNGNCSSVEQCGTIVDAVVIAAPVVNADGTCVTDVTYRTGSTETKEAIELCAGPGGEKREISVETKPLKSFGPCQKLHCQSGGKCDAFTVSESKCLCPQNTTGPECYSLSTGGTCGTTIDKPTATGLAQKGLVKCTCMVNGKKVEIIKNNPPPSTKNIVMAAGMGAGGMTGTMVIGAVIYIIVTKMKKTHHVHPGPS